MWVLFIIAFFIFVISTYHKWSYKYMYTSKGYTEEDNNK